MENKTFTPEQALHTIEQSIKETQTISTGAAYYFKLWGALLFIHFMLNAIRLAYPAIASTWLVNVSILVFPLGGILSGMRKKFDKKTETVVPMFEKIYFSAFITFALAYAVLFVTSLRNNPIDAVIYFPLLLGITVMICGLLTQFKPGIFGGIISIFCFGFSTQALPDMIYVSAAIAALLACFIPGILMKGKHV
ncbi:MAG: hypothetical protein FGM54_03325 [Chitinophagaceae bacterium]|nr:hypothetical protein [Chitinophagaceae bacterium]